MILFRNSVILLVLCLIGFGFSQNETPNGPPNGDTDFSKADCDKGIKEKIEMEVACIAMGYPHGGCCQEVDVICARRNALKKECKPKTDFDKHFEDSIKAFTDNCMDPIKPSKSECEKLWKTPNLKNCPKQHSYSCDSTGDGDQNPERKPDSKNDTIPEVKPDLNDTIPEVKPDKTPDDSSVTPISVDRLSLCFSFIISLIILFKINF